jgi:hypothetical protein
MYDLDPPVRHPEIVEARGVGQQDGTESQNLLA